VKDELDFAAHVMLILKLNQFSLRKEHRLVLRKVSHWSRQFPQSHFRLVLFTRG
jgi:hypothetical protein